MTRRLAVAILLALLAGFALGRGTAAAPRAARDIPAGPAAGTEPDRGQPGAPGYLAGVSPAPLVAPALAEPGQPTTAPAATSGGFGIAAPVVSVGRGGSLQGLASWYRYVPGQAAAGPQLRALLGPGWRGMVVTVNGIPVRLSDWCQCFEGTATERIIDLDSRTFAQLAPLGRGLVVVEVQA